MIEIQIANDQFLPGQEIAGEVRWADLKESDRIEVRLIWYTSGKGTRDLEIVHVHPVDSVHGSGKEKFSFKAASHPYSFSGKLISIVWAVEAVVLPSGDVATKPILIGPGGLEVVVVSEHPLDD